MIVYVLAWFERHEGCAPDGYDVFATKEAAFRVIESHNATGAKRNQMKDFTDSAQNAEMENLVRAWSDGQWYVYLTEHGVQE